VSEQIQWKDLYGTALVDELHFGDVTTIQSVTQATKGALTLKSRKLNCEATRILPILSATDTAPFYEFLTPAPTRDMANILAAMCLDPKIGGRVTGELNLPGFRATSDEIAAYFNRNVTRNFSHTFDEANISFEETVKCVEMACFSKIYRRGNIINVQFEKLTTASKLIFNHTNKIPKSEKRSYRFGPTDGYDGIELEYVDPSDSSPQTIFLPADRSAVKSRTVKTIGVRSKTQATLLAYRIYNKMLYQKVNVEFVGLQEASLLAQNDRILIANNVRLSTQDGEVRGLDGVNLTTSQPVKFESGQTYNIFLQAADMTVQSIPVTAGADEYHVVLDSEPVGALSLDPANYTLATYVIAGSADQTALAFLVLDRTYDGPMSSKVQAINYDPRYYQNDQDFSARILHYMTAVIDDPILVYDDATTEQKADGGFWANGAVVPPTIPTAGDPAYVFSSGVDEE
jgi:hypothetical protein